MPSAKFFTEKDTHPNERVGGRLLSKAHRLDAREAPAFPPAPLRRLVPARWSLDGSCEEDLTAGVAENLRRMRREKRQPQPSPRRAAKIANNTFSRLRSQGYAPWAHGSRKLPSL